MCKNFLSKQLRSFPSMKHVSNRIYLAVTSFSNVYLLPTAHLSLISVSFCYPLYTLGGAFSSARGRFFKTKLNQRFEASVLSQDLTSFKNWLTTWTFLHLKPLLFKQLDHTLHLKDEGYNCCLWWTIVLLLLTYLHIFPWCEDLCKKKKCLK